MKTKLTLLSLAFLSLPVFAGQFDHVYAGKRSATSRDPLELNWERYFPGLQAEIEQAFEQARKDGEFIFNSNQIPVAWNVTAAGGVVINSVNSGFFMNYRNPDNPSKLLFPGLQADEQGVSIVTGGDITISPRPTEQEGFGYAVSVGYDTTTTLQAGGKIVLMTPYSDQYKSYQDELAIAVGDDGQLKMKAEDIYIFGTVDAQYGAKIDIKATNNLNFLQPTDAGGNVEIKSPLRLLTADMELSAKNILFNRPVAVGVLFLDISHPSSLIIQDDPDANIKVENVYFNKPVLVEKDSDLKVDIAGNVVFNEGLSLLSNGQSEVTASGIRLQSLTLGNLGAKADFNVRDNGVMYVDKKIEVGHNSHLNINLGEKSALRAQIVTHHTQVVKELGTASLTMGPQSFWASLGDSRLTNLTLSKGSVVDMGDPNTALTITTETLGGDGGLLWYRPGAKGTLEILVKSAGSHQALLGSTGKDISSADYLWRPLVIESLTDKHGQAVFSLANNGIIEAGPYQYKLGLYNADKGTRTYWFVGAKDIKLAPAGDTPSEPETPDQPGEPDQPETFIPPPNFDVEDPSTYPDYLIPKPEGLSESAKLALAAVGQGTQVTQYLGALAELRERLGEIRNNFEEDTDGAYVLFRYDQSRLSFFQGVNGKLRNYGTAVGVNRKVSPNLIVGADIDIGYAKLKINDFGEGKAHTNSLGARGYLTWFNQAGTYADLVMSFNHYRHRMSTKMLDGDSTSARYSNVGAGVSAEVGHRFQFLEKGQYDHYFIQPQLQLSSYWLKGKSFSLSNGMDVSVKDGKSLTGRVGVDIGKNFLIGDKKPAQVYLRGGILHEFLGKTKTQLNEFNFEDESLGTRAYYGVGFEVRAKDRVKLYAQLNRESGHRIKTDVQVRFGASIFF